MSCTLTLTADFCLLGKAHRQLCLRYSVEIYKCTNASELISNIKLSRSPFGLHKLWPTLHIATEILVTLHPGATGLCFMIKVWLVTLIGLTNFT